MDPDRFDSRVLLFGCNPASVDAAAAVVMGFDPQRIPIVSQAFTARGFPLVEGAWRAVQCTSNRSGWSGSLGDVFDAGDVLRFRAPFGWVGHVEAARA